jgi:gluconate 2-dehydrogenase gamma chain
MTERHIPRRTFVAAAAAGAGAIWLGVRWLDLKQAGEHAAVAGANPDYKLETFSQSQAADMDALMSQIIPGEEGSPGAHEAHALQFTDHVLANVLPDLKPQYIKGLTEFQALVAKRHGKTPFAQLSSTDQQALITEIEKAKSEFFVLVRAAAINGMFASPEYGGNLNKAGWKMIGFEDDFSWQPPFGYYDRPENANA